MRPPTITCSSLAKGELWRVITPIFGHFDGLHLIFNMIMFFQFGALIESLKGTAWLGGPDPGDRRRVQCGSGPGAAWLGATHCLAACRASCMGCLAMLDQVHVRAGAGFPTCPDDGDDPDRLAVPLHDRHASGPIANIATTWWAWWWGMVVVDTLHPRSGDNDLRSRYTWQTNSIRTGKRWS